MNDAATAAATTDKLTVKLRKPIQAHAQTLGELVFREPTGGDIEHCGVPCSFRWVGESEGIAVSIDSKAMTAMIGSLAAIPPSSVRQLDSRDWVACAFALQGFFLPT